jgi:hypothetical protein
MRQFCAGIVSASGKMAIFGMQSDISKALISESIAVSRNWDVSPEI